MKILYDHQIYSRQNFGGISRYFYELSKGLVENNIKVINSIKFSDNIYTRDKGIFTAKQFLLKQDFKGKRSLQNSLNIRNSLKALKSDRFDIFHPTYYNAYFAETLRISKPIVVTFYDLIHEKFSDEYPIFKEENLEFRKGLIDRADALIAISNSTKNDMVEIYGVNPNKIQVIYLGNSIKVSPTAMTGIVKKSYILFVGNRSFYKNFDFFISAITETLKTEKNLIVICAGSNSFTLQELNMFRLLGIEDKVKHQYIDDISLSILYQNALFFVFPSCYEGFGIPVLEAFACSCPVILSNRSSLPEVGGDAVIYINPENREDIIEKVNLVLKDPDLREEMKKRGQIQLAKFSWQKMVEETIVLYQSLL